MQNILVPVDFSAVTQRVLEHVVPLARAFKSTLWLLHVAAPDPDFAGYEAGPESVREGVELTLPIATPAPRMAAYAVDMCLMWLLFAGTIALLAVSFPVFDWA